VGVAVPEEAVGRVGTLAVVVVTVVVTVAVVLVALVLSVIVGVRALIVPATLVESARMVSAVLFDFYGTLARAVTWGPTVEEVLGRRGIRLNPKARARWEAESADGVDHRQHSSDRDRYVAWERARLRRLAERSRVQPTDLDEVVAELYATSKDFTLEAYDEVPNVLAALRRQGVMVAVCSNWDWDLDGAMRRAGLDTLVDVVVTSAQAGVRKPHPQIYHHALAMCGVRAADALFVGDSWGPDVEGPLATGLQPVHIWRKGAPGFNGRPHRLIRGVRRIPDLHGVLDLV
jgi:putative hydrolase of the HAD superfamily